MATFKIMNEAYEQVIYPNILIKSGSYNVVSTTLRMKHEGKWYLCNFLRRSFDTEEVLMKILHKEVYKMQHIGKVNPELTDIFGNKVFTLDNNQESETDRITRLVEKMEL